MSMITQAGPELDAVVGEKVMGCQITSVTFEGRLWYRCACAGAPHGQEDSEGERSAALQEYSADIAAAWQVVERILAIEKAKETYLPVFSVQTSPTGSSAVLQVGMGCEVAAENASTAPLAICLAALKVLEAKR